MIEFLKWSVLIDGDSQDDDELGVGVVDELGEGKGAKSCEDSKKLRLLSRVHLVDNMINMVVEKMTIIKHSFEEWSRRQPQ